MKIFQREHEPSTKTLPMPPPHIVKPYIICDIDGVLADCSHRLHFIVNNGGFKDWDEFDRFTPYDRPILETIFLLNTLALRGFRIILMTGRGERVYQETRTWLEYHGVNYDELHMRREGDRRPAFKVKIEHMMMQDLRAANVFCIFEDEPDTISRLRAEGHLVYDPLEWQDGWEQVNEGGKDHPKEEE